MSAETTYDFARDNEAIVKDHAEGNHTPTQPFVVYKDGEFKGAFRTYGDACEWGYKQGIMGSCTVRDVFAPPPTLGPMFGVGFEAGYTRGLEDAAMFAKEEIARPGGGHPLHQGYWQAGAKAVLRGIEALLKRRTDKTAEAKDNG